MDKKIATTRAATKRKNYPKKTITLDMRVIDDCDDEALREELSHLKRAVTARVYTASMIAMLDEPGGVA